MELAGTRALRDWLAGTTNPSYGVNTLLASVPVDAGDAAPAGFATFADATREPWVARRLWDDPAIEVPACVVLAEPFTLDGEVQTTIRDARITFIIGQLVRDASSAVQLRDALYRRRALLQSLAQFNANANQAARERNSVALIACESLEVAFAGAEKGSDAWAIDAIRATYLVRDLAP